MVGGYAGRIVRGLQGGGGGGDGSGPGLGGLGPRGVVACAKHWVGDGGTDAGVDQGDTVVDEAELRRVHIAPYVPALEAGVLTVMVSLSSWNGMKCHAHRYLIRDVLKGEMGFGGFVISDWNGIDPLADDYGEAAAMAVNAGDRHGDGAGDVEGVHCGVEGAGVAWDGAGGADRRRGGADSAGEEGVRAVREASADGAAGVERGGVRVRGAS